MKIIFLGTGPAEPIEDDGKTVRLNSSIALTDGDVTIIVDATSSLLEQVNSAGIKNVDVVMLTHGHSDAISGISQLSNWQPNATIFCSSSTAETIKKKFAKSTINGFKFIEASPYIESSFGDFKVIPVPVVHSTRGYQTLAYLFKYKNASIMYSPDLGSIPEKSSKYFSGLDIWILDAAMYFSKTIPGHQNVESAVELVKKYKPKRCYFTQIGHTYPKHEIAEKEISDYWNRVKGDVETELKLAYDGLVINVGQYFEMFTIIGSKRNQKDFIIKHVPDWVKTVYDPMSGSGAILHELKSRGCTVYANDISPFCYYWLKAILGKTKMSKEWFEELANAEPKEGWLTKASVLRPKRKEARMFIDGLAIKARSFDGVKRDLALGLLSSFLTRLQGSLGIFRRQFEPYRKDVMLKILKSAWAEMNDLINENGDAHVTNMNALDMDIPKVDMIYFDPPYDMTTRREVPYGPHYKIINSILEQKDCIIDDFPREKIPELVEKYCKNADVILISTGDDIKIDYRKILSSNGKTVRVEKFTRKTGGAAPKADKIQTDLLWIGYPYVTNSMSSVDEGIYLAHPHARLIWNGEKTLIIRGGRYTGMVGKPLYVLDSDYAYGIIKLKKPIFIGLDAFKRLRNNHLISDAERIKWWGGRKHFYAYPFEVIEMFKVPRKISIPSGVQTFVKSIKFVDENMDYSIYESEDFNYDELAELDDRKKFLESVLGGEDGK